MTRTLSGIRSHRRLAAALLACLMLGLCGGARDARAAQLTARTPRPKPASATRRPAPATRRPAPAPATRRPQRHRRRHRRPVRRHPTPTAAPLAPPAIAAPPGLPAAPPPSPAPAPRATTTAPTSVSDVGATLTGLVAAVGPAGRIEFEWGTAPTYGEIDPVSPAIGTGATRRVSVTLSGLAPATTYHARLVARACGGCRTGTDYGQDVTFTTSGYENPVWSLAEAADPSVLDVDGAHDDYWAFVTGDRFPILHSTDLLHWTMAGLALAQRPEWAVATGDWHPWAPHVVQSDRPCPGAAGGGCFVMYYVALSAATGANCVAVATAPAPGGPYTDRGPLSNGTLDAEGRPVGCGDNAGYGQIDPSVFIDPASGARYLYVSEDFACPAAGSSCTADNSVLQPTISVIPLSPDGLSATGPRTPLFSGTPGSWEAAGAAVATVEGPMALEHDGTYYLLYSGGSWHSQYAMGYATAASPLGPFTRSTANPILSSGAGVIGPGGGDTPVTGPAGGQWLVYHGRTGSDDAPRVLRVDPFRWAPAAGGGPDIPVIGGPSSGPQAIAP
jgi:hypothetical protein